MLDKVEALMQQALEAVDLLDNALALEKVRGRGGQAARRGQHCFGGIWGPGVRHA